MKTLLSLGYGYTARLFARALIAQGWRVIGTTRDAAKARALEAEGVEPLLWQPGAKPEAAIAAATHILHSASPIDGHDPFMHLAPLLREAGPEWFGYLSTTGVYGDTGGAWVDEDSPLAPARGRSADRAAAEAAWLASGLPLHVFRLAGIYGPGRGPFARLRSGQAQRIVKPGQVFSRIYVEDIVRVLLASIARPDPGRIYNLCDDLPAGADEVLVAAAQMIGLPLPEALDFATAELSPMARSFYAECRRVRNDRIKAELGVVLQCPDYHAGLRAILAAEAADQLSENIPGV